MSKDLDFVLVSPGVFIGSVALPSLAAFPVALETAGEDVDWGKEFVEWERALRCLRAASGSRGAVLALGLVACMGFQIPGFTSLTMEAIVGFVGAVVGLRVGDGTFAGICACVVLSLGGGGVAAVSGTS